MIWLAGQISPDFRVDGIGWGILLSIIVTVVNIVGTTLLGIDDDNLYWKNVVRKSAREEGVAPTDVPGVLFLEIDGLAHDVLQRAMRNGHAPNLTRWLEEGSHRLMPVGVRLVEPDGRQPGRAPARHQRGHAGLPLVREGARGGHGLQPPEGHHRDPAAHQRRQRPAGRRRGEPGQHVLGGRPPHPPDPQQRHRARAREGGSRLLRLLREPLLAHADDRADGERHDPREVGVDQRAPPGRAPARPPRRALSAGARVDDRDPARSRRDGAALGRLRGPAGGLLDLRRLRRDRPPLRHRAPGDPAGAGAARPAVPPARAGHRRRAPALRARRALRPRPDRRHALPPALRGEPRGPGGPADR